MLVSKTVEFPFFTKFEDYHDGPYYAQFLSEILSCKVMCEELVAGDDYRGYPECQKLAKGGQFDAYPFRFFLPGQED